MAVYTTASAFQGIAGPLMFNDQGNLALLTNEELIQSDLVFLIETGIADCFMEPLDGVGLSAQLFEPNDPQTYMRLENYIRDRINALDGRVNVTSVKARRVDEAEGESKVAIQVMFKIPALISEGQTTSYRISMVL